MQGFGGWVCRRQPRRAFAFADGGAGGVLNSESKTIMVIDNYADWLDELGIVAPRGHDQT